MSRPAVSVVMPFAGDAGGRRGPLDALLVLDLAPGDELILADNCGRRGGARRRSRWSARPASTRPPTPATSAPRARTATGSCSSTPTAGRRAGLLDALLRARRSPTTSARSPARSFRCPRAHTLAARYGAARNFLGQDAHLSHPYLPRAVAANLLVRRAAFEQVGGFYEGRAGRRGHRLQLAPAARRLEARGPPRARRRASLPDHDRRAAAAVARLRRRARVAGAAATTDFEPEPAVRGRRPAATRRSRCGAGAAGRRTVAARGAPARPAPAGSSGAATSRSTRCSAVEELAGFALSNRPSPRAGDRRPAWCSSPTLSRPAAIRWSTSRERSTAPGSRPRRGPSRPIAAGRARAPDRLPRGRRHRRPGGGAGRRLRPPSGALRGRCDRAAGPPSRRCRRSRPRSRRLAPRTGRARVHPLGGGETRSDRPADRAARGPAARRRRSGG